MKFTHFSIAKQVREKQLHEMYYFSRTVLEIEKLCMSFINVYWLVSLFFLNNHTLVASINKDH